MELIKSKAKVLTKEWAENLYIKEKIPDNTLFYSFSLEGEKKEDLLKLIGFYVKHNNEFYSFNKKTDELKKIKADDPFLIKKNINEIKVKNILPEDIKDFWKKYLKLVSEYHVKNNSNHILSEEDIKAFSVYNIEALPVNGASWFMKKASRIDYDGIQYCIAFHHDNYEENLRDISHGVDHFNQVKERHHHLIKDVYKYLTKEEKLENIWVLMGGGAQIQAFFGNETGYLGILYLDMDTPQENNKKNDEYLSVCGNEKFTLVVNFEINNKYFENFSHENIICRKSENDN